MRNKIIKRVLIGALVLFGCLIVAALLFVPVLDGDKRQRANQASTVGTFRYLIRAQVALRDAKPSRGYSCQLAPLEPYIKNEFPDFGPPSFFVDGARRGYTIAIVGCLADKAGPVTRYRLTAVPRELGTTGFMAYCTSEEGVIWYDASGSAEACLANRKPLE
jgi:hypothetical protein